MCKPCGCGLTISLTLLQGMARSKSATNTDARSRDATSGPIPGSRVPCTVASRSNRMQKCARTRVARRWSCPGLMSASNTALSESSRSAQFPNVNRLLRRAGCAFGASCFIYLRCCPLACIHLTLCLLVQAWSQSEDMPDRRMPEQCKEKSVVHQVNMKWLQSHLSLFACVFV